MNCVVGVDGCPAGWIAVIWGQSLCYQLFSRFTDILALEAEIIAVDMPVGLPGLSGRRAEREARAVLGERRSSVFSIPSRAAFAGRDYRDCCRINLEHSEPPRKISKQAYNLFPKILEIDRLMTPHMQSRVHEVHPELAFWVMNGRVPVAIAKKMKGENLKTGLALRRELLLHNGFPLSRLPPSQYRLADVGEDDLIDACACAFSARRILEGQHLSFPATPEADERGLAMMIKA